MIKHDDVNHKTFCLTAQSTVTTTCYTSVCQQKAAKNSGRRPTKDEENLTTDRIITPQNLRFELKSFFFCKIKKEIQFSMVAQSYRL